MTGRRLRRPSVMRTDDSVAPGLRRSRASWLTAIGLGTVIVALVLILIGLDDRAERAQRDASLSGDEVTELRDFLDQRGVQRDAERAEVQAQLDAQRRALCQAIATLAVAAGDQTRAVLDQAAADLNCASLPPPAPVPSSSGTSTGAPAAPGTGPGSAAPAAPTDQPRRPSPSPQPPAAPPPGAAPTSPPPTEDPGGSDPGGLLDPITEPVCDLLGSLCPGGG